jgi:hypothetical protein
MPDWNPNGGRGWVRSIRAGLTVISHLRFGATGWLGPDRSDPVKPNPTGSPSGSKRIKVDPTESWNYRQGSERFN